MNYNTDIVAEKQHTAVDAAGHGADLDDGVAVKSGGRKMWIVVILVLLGAAAAAAWYYSQASDGAGADEGQQGANVAVVSVVAPGKATVEGTIEASGSLAARREVPVGVVGEGGRVVSVPFDEGQWVSAGQTLVSIDRSVQNQQAAAASASISVAQADANLAQSNLDRALQLVDRGFISKADVDRLTATRDAANARVRVSRAQLAELRARNARLNIVAPTSGLILERNVEPGQTVGGASGALFLIARGGEMELMAQVSEADLSRISAGVEAQVTPVGSEKAFTGQVWQIAPTIDETNRQGIARVALPYDTALRPGGFANAVIRSGTVVAPVLPESALQSDDSGNYVYIVDADNKVVRRDITLGQVTPQGVIVSGGLSGSERVVLRSGGFRNPGETVKPVLVKE